MSGFASSGGAGLFLAAVPDEGTARRIHRLAGALKRAHRFDGRLTPPGRLHISLFFLGGVHEWTIHAACEAAADVRAAPFEVSFDRTASFRGRSDNRPFVLIGEVGTSRLRSFRQMLGSALARRGLRRVANTNFTPHVTLLYGAHGVEEHPIEPIFWTVTEFVLIHSMNGYDQLARWSLRV